MEGLKKKERVRTEGMKGERKERKVNKMGTQKRTKRKRTEQTDKKKKRDVGMRSFCLVTTTIQQQ